MAYPAAHARETLSAAAPYSCRMPGPAPRPLTEPHPERLEPHHPLRAEILSRHAAALAAGQPGYADPASGLFVVTAAYLADRGTCCEQGCRHCPYVT